ncbi:MAG TPA: energy transducer TonB, partial [Spongiibacteraceae bacterium]|nr:energy transducer TonB [Spongiibacteraceae bacterium]
PPPRLEAPPPYVPPPDILLAAEPVAAQTTAIHDVTNVKAPPPVAAPPSPDVEARFNPRSRKNAPGEDDYPSASRRLNEQGDVIIAIWVTADGTVGEVKVEKSSGFERLDEAAVTFYQKLKLLPATKDGKPIAAWKTLKVTWKLKK